VGSSFDNANDCHEQGTGLFCEGGGYATGSKPSASYVRLKQVAAKVTSGLRARVSTTRLSKIEKQYAKTAERFGVTPEKQQQIESMMQTVVANSEVRVRAPPAVVEQIIKDGRFKSQFETGTSKGMLNNEWRAGMERELFDIPEESPAAERPIYGYLADKGTGTGGEVVGVDAYGSAVITLRDGIMDRSTVFIGDTIDDAGITGSMIEPRTTAVPLKGDKLRLALDPSVVNEKQNPGGSAILRAKTPTEMMEYTMAIYPEVQMHGGVSTSDIAMIRVPKDMPSVAAWCKTSGVRYQVGYA
jgi:hypothetical protein